ncbi:fungal hydrophobin [Trametes meyenii]|nr:fungal hydrophobin [Trametes meyenii]
MQFFATLTALALALVGAVSAMPSWSQSSAQCDTGSAHCCQDVQPASSESLGSYGPLSFLSTLDPETPVGVSCVPINTASVGGSQSCSAMPMCCSGNNYGSFSMGCSPVPVTV